MKTIVIGAGLAGVTAAVYLADAGHQVTVFERSHFIGGRAGSIHEPTAQQELDLAQHVFLFCCTRYRALLDRLGTTAHAPVQSPLNIPVIDARTYPGPGAVSRLRSSPLPSKVHMAPSFLRFRHLGLSERLQTARTLLKIGKLNRADPKYAVESFATWLRAQGESPRSLTAFWDVFVVAALNASVSDVSAAWGLMLFQEAMLKDRHGPEVGIPTVPLSQLLTPANAILQERGGRVSFGRAVRQVVVEDGAVRGVLASGGGEAEQIHDADRVIMAVGHRDVKRLLPSCVSQLPHFAEIDQLPSHSIIDLHIGFGEPAAPTDLNSGVFINSPVQWFFWHDEGRRLSLSISNPGDLAQQRAAEIEVAMVQEVRRLFGCAAPSWVVTRRHRNATFSLAPGHDRYRRPQRTPIRGLYLAGDWTETGWPATMEGAVISGERAAEAALVEANRP